ncbi:hypothetical protein FKP32DRAFT_1689329, partial [Trametes sanguinea]
MRAGSLASSLDSPACAISHALLFASRSCSGGGADVARASLFIIVTCRFRRPAIILRRPLGSRLVRKGARRGFASWEEGCGALWAADSEQWAASSGQAAGRQAGRRAGMRVAGEQASISDILIIVLKVEKGAILAGAQRSASFSGLFRTDLQLCLPIPISRMHAISGGQSISMLTARSKGLVTLAWPGVRTSRYVQKGGERSDSRWASR